MVAQSPYFAQAGNGFLGYLRATIVVNEAVNFFKK
jgi:hypothetical protein